MTGSRRMIVAILAVSALVTGACGGDNEPSPQTGGTSPTAASTGPVHATLKEWSVLLRTGDYDRPAGSVSFDVNNEGPKHKHEFVLVKTDLAPSALPTKPDGSVNEDGAGIQVIGEIEEFDVGKTQSKTFTLAAGKYVLFCNVVEDPPTADMAGIKAHYKLGMFFQDPFIVT